MEFKVIETPDYSELAKELREDIYDNQFAWSYINRIKPMVTDHVYSWHVMEELICGDVHITIKCQMGIPTDINVYKGSGNSYLTALNKFATSLNKGKALYNADAHKVLTQMKIDYKFNK